MLKVVFFGSGPYILPIIEALNSSFDLSLVVATETDPQSLVINFCSKNNIKFVSVAKFNSHNISEIEKIGARGAVLAHFGLIIPKQVLDLFEQGIINVHPSLLPKYRGATPGQSAILAGESKTGVSIIKLDEEVDHGPVLAQIEERIEPTDTSETLYRRLFQKGARLLSQVLPKYIAGELKPIAQDHSKATFTERLTRESGLIELTKPPRQPQLDRMIRAYYPWPGVWFRYQCHPEHSEGSLLDRKIIKLLPEDRIQVEGKNIMTLKDFANGYPEGKEILEKIGLL